jgi:L-alanine-DL-glutamate epimerase-like enolase superfamily enzyme
MEIDGHGFVHVPEGPGLGIDLDEDTIDNLRVR